MPYITKEQKGKLQEPCNGYSPQNAGELNYFLTEVMLKYLKDKGLSYQTINDISGAMTESLAEFRRRITADYEDMKRSANGDVYPNG